MTLSESAKRLARYSVATGVPMRQVSYTRQ